MTNKIYTTSEAAKKLGVSTRSLERWRQNESFIPDTKTIGGHSRYSDKQIKNLSNKSVQEDLENFMK